MSLSWECPRCRMIHGPLSSTCNCYPPTSTSTTGAGVLETTSDYQRGYNEGYDAALQLKQPCRCRGEG